MRIEDSRAVLRMELCADVPALLGNLNYLNKIGSRIDTYTLHAMGFELFLILIVELIAMAMALTDEGLFAIGFIDTTALDKLAIVSTKAHSTTELGNIFLLFHDIYYIDWSFGRLVVWLFGNISNFS